MDVRRVDELDDVVLAQWYDALHRGTVFERPWEVFAPRDVFERLLRVPMSDLEHEAYGAFDDDRLVGALLVSINLLSNTDKLELEFAVPPEHRRLGAGRAMVELGYERARQAGARFALCWSSYPFEERETHFINDFARSVGLSLDQDEVHRHRRLPVETSLLDQLAADAAPHHADYDVEVWSMDVPADLFDSWVEVHNLLALDAPMGEVPYEKDKWDKRVWDEVVEFLTSTGQQMLLAVAISPEREVVAFSDLVVRKSGLEVDQWGTLVRSDHRGHRLGTAIKVANLQRLQRDFPAVQRLDTVNAEVNEAMININARLGLEPVAVLPAFYREV